MLQAKLELVSPTWVPLQSVRKFRFRCLHKNTDSESHKLVIVSSGERQSLREQDLVEGISSLTKANYIVHAESHYAVLHHRKSFLQQCRCQVFFFFFLHSGCKYFVWVPSILSKWSVHTHPTPSTPSLFFKCMQQYICICLSLSVTSSTLFWVVNVT